MRKFNYCLLIGLQLITFTGNAQWSTKAPNTYNPYDSVGLIHNEALIYCRNQLTGSGTSRALSYLSARYNDIEYDSISHAVSLGAYCALHDSSHYNPTFMSATGRSYASQLISAIDDISDTSETDDVAGSIVSLESSFMGSINLPDSEKIILLSAGSIARFSLYYWKDSLGDYSDVDEVMPIAYSGIPDNNNMLFAIGENGPYCDLFGSSSSEQNQVIFDPNSKMPYKKGWLRRLLHIVVGDVVGAIIGGGLGSLTTIPPVAVFGAIMGGISGSLAAADAEGLLEN